MGNHISHQTTPIELPLGSRGKIRGTQYDEKSRRYAGVPYALPPTGDHRWRKPPPLPETYVYQSPDGSAYDATNFKPVCPQKLFSKVAKAEGEQVEYSEDCLFVNIWVSMNYDDVIAIMENTDTQDVVLYECRQDSEHRGCLYNGQLPVPTQTDFEAFLICGVQAEP